MPRRPIRRSMTRTTGVWPAVVLPQVQRNSLPQRSGKHAVEAVWPAGEIATCGREAHQQVATRSGSPLRSASSAPKSARTSRTIGVMRSGCRAADTRYLVRSTRWARGMEHAVPASADVLYYAIKRKYVLGMQLRYNYRLYPSPGQRAALARAFGCARVVFNDSLRIREQAYEAGLPYVTDGELSARLTASKATPQRVWLGEVSAVVLQQSLADLNTAYRNFFASVTGKGPKTGPPRYKSRKDHRQAVRFTANARFRVLASGKLRLPRIGDVPVRWSRDLPSEPSSVTVIRDSAGRYFASFVIATRPVTVPGTGPVTGPVIGIDLGLTHFAVLSDGRKIASR